MSAMDRDRSARRRWQVIETPPPPPLPDVEELAPSVLLRPGEFREPTQLTDHDAIRAVCAQAGGVGMAPTQALPLLAEAHLVRSDLRATGLGWKHVRTLLTDTARAARVAQPLASADAAYLRALTSGAQRIRPTEQLPETLIAPVSVRVLRRLSLADLHQACHEPLEEIRAWEVAALAQGRTLGEWALLVVLRASR
jgi:hypothetical protein